MEKCVYLNNAATSYPKPRKVIDAVAKTLSSPPFHHARTGFDHQSVDHCYRCRVEIAELFNIADPNRIAFSSGSTESLNLALSGLDLDGKHVITTGMEHNSVYRPLKTMQHAGRITLSIVECDRNGLVQASQLEQAVRTETGALVINHCSNVSGAVNDLKAFSEIAHKKHIPLIVDASQSAGVYPLDVREMGIDILAFTGHKSLYGIQGIGGAYIGQDVNLKPLKVGGTGVRSDYLFQPESLPMYYEAGTQNLPGIIALYEGLRYIRKKGIDTIRQQKSEMVARMRQALSNNENITLYPAYDCGFDPTLFSFTVTGMDPGDIGYILESNFNIIVRSGLHCAPLIHKYIGTFPAGSVRVSPSTFTTDDEIDSFIGAVESILKMVN